MTAEEQRLADELTAGHGRVLELEAERAANARRIDEVLDDGDDAAVLALVRRQRALGIEVAELRGHLAELAATRRLLREA